MMDLDISVNVNALIVEYLMYKTATKLPEVEKGIKYYFDLWHKQNPGKTCSPSNNWLANCLDSERVYLQGTPYERCASPNDLIAEIAASSVASLASHQP